MRKWCGSLALITRDQQTTHTVSAEMPMKFFSSTGCGTPSAVKSAAAAVTIRFGKLGLWRGLNAFSGCSRLTG